MKNAVATIDNPQAVAPFLDDHLLGMLRDKRFDGDSPPAISDPTRTRCRALLAEYDEYLLPGSERWILSRVATAFGHYFAVQASGALEKGVARDWLAVLGKRPAWAVDKAISEWVEDEPSKRPTPAAIGNRAIHLAELTYERRNRLEHCLRAARRIGEIDHDDAERRRPKTDSEKAQIRKLVEETVRKLRSSEHSNEETT